MAATATATVLTPITARLHSASESPTKMGMNAVLFGPPGVGKTTLCAQAQDSEFGRNVIFIDVEGGTRSISDRSDITVFRPSEFADLREIFDYLADGDHTFQTIVIDTLNELQKLGLRDIMQTAKDPEWPGIQDWGRSTEQITRMVRAFRGLSQERGWNVFFTAHANKQKDELTGRVFIEPNLTPKATEMVCGAVDMVGYLQFDMEGKRELLLQPTNTITAKYRQPRTGPQLPAVIKEPNLVQILEHLRTGEVYHVDEG